MVVIIAVLASLPAIVGALPVDAKNIPVATLLAKVRASDQVAYSGLASSSGQLALPDLGVGGNVIDLLSATNRLRVWWASPSHYRVDRVTFAAENDEYRNGQQLWTWDSDQRLAILSEGVPQIPLPGPEDALPANLTRRLLADAPAQQVAPISSRRIAGRTALGVVWNPHDKRSLIGQIKAWVDQDSGLPLAVQVSPVGSGSKAFTSSYLDLQFKAPNPAQLQFDPTRDPTANVDNTEPSGPDASRPMTTLPASLAGLRQRSAERPLVATYGHGVSVVAVSRIDPLSAGALRQQIDSPSRPPIKGKFGQGSLMQAPLLTGLIFATKVDGYVLLGSVTRDQIEAMALDLVRHPPPQSVPQVSVGRRP
jgi:hypothetical protein